MTFPAVPLSNPWSNVFVNATTMYNNTTLPLNELQTVMTANGFGEVGHAFLTVNLTGIGGLTSQYLTVPTNMIAGRKYLGIATCEGLQNTATSVVNIALATPGATAVFSQYFTTTNAGITIYGTATALFTPSTTGSYSFYCAASSTAGSLTLYPGSYLSVIDLGTV